jgi:phage terminase small subunit
MPLPEMDMLQMLQRVALGEVEATPLQVRAAIAAVQYTHTKKGDGGKKEEQADRAKQAGTGRFKASTPPLKLVQR